MKTSPIDGNGVFATRDYRAGEIIRSINIVREVTDSDPLGPGENPDHCMYAIGRVFLVGDPDRYLNHCCEPSAYKRFGPNGVTIVALRDIAKGEEVTLDYVLNTHGGSTWHCSCGAPECRGEMASSFFDLPRRVQQKYLPYLADWFVQAHRERVRALRAVERRS